VRRVCNAPSRPQTADPGVLLEHRPVVGRHGDVPHSTTFHQPQRRVLTAGRVTCCADPARGDRLVEFQLAQARLDPRISRQPSREYTANTTTSSSRCGPPGAGRLTLGLTADCPSRNIAARRDAALRRRRGTVVIHPSRPRQPGASQHPRCRNRFIARRSSAPGRDQSKRRTEPAGLHKRSAPGDPLHLTGGTRFRARSRRTHRRA